MRNVKDLIKKGFIPEETADIADEVYVMGSAYPESIICRWWAENKVGERLLIEEKVLKVVEEK